MKYEFIKKDIDTTILKYKDKEFEFKSTVELTSKIQGYIQQSRLKMIRDLAKEGMTIEDLIVVKEKDGKTYRDETNRLALEKQYEDNAVNDVINEICEKTFKMKLADLIMDIGIIEEKEAIVFTGELFNKLLGKSPSGEKRQDS